MKSMYKNKGMTLIELMIVMAILAIVASIAYPAYQDQMTKTRRSDGQAKLMEIMNAQERYFTNYGTYTASITAADPTGLGYSNANSEKGFYTISAAACGGGLVQCVSLTATAQGAQASDGNLTFNSQGVKAPANKW
ncbi:MAG: type IV pilin protein [Gammaproteobacteria bacterium]